MKELILLFGKKELNVGFPCFPGLSWKPISFKPFLVGNHEPQKGRVQVVSPNRASPSLAAELLYVWDDEYKGVIIDP